MYKNVCRLLLENGARLLYTTSRAVGDTLKELEKEYPSFHSEVSLNEKIGFELALTGSYVTKRTACLFTTDGIYEALDPVMSSAYTGVVGGFLIVCMKETDEKVTPLGSFSKLPVIVTEDMDNLARSIGFGYDISEKYGIPVIIQMTPALDEGQRTKPALLRSARPGDKGRKTRNSKLVSFNPAEGGTTRNPKLTVSRFTKNPARWAATPKFRFQLHKELNGKIENIREEFEKYEGNVTIKKGKTGVITDRHLSMEFYDEDASMLRLSTVHPLPHKLVDAFIKEMDKVYIDEEQYPAVELQIRDRRKVTGRKVEKARPRKRAEETMYGFKVMRDVLGPGSSINMAHGIKKLEPDRQILAITYEDHFFHSGMPAFVNTLYNNSSYVLLIMTNEKEQEIRSVMEGCGFHNFFHIDKVSEIEQLKDRKDLTVLFYRGLV